jgi:hypothetical protein
MNRDTRGRANGATAIQTLEDRRMLTVFGNPWPDARNLAVSFPTDGVEVGSYTNDINQTLDQIATRQQWQELSLRAFQTWAIHADINVGLRNDYGNGFGVPGMTVGDPRFGEFRIGAFPQTGVLANSVPFQAVAGTYSGDLLLNSNQEFTFHDWENDLGPDPATINAGERDLFSLFLHEIGNTLGVDDNMMEWTVMFRQYTVPKGVLSAEDIASIQAIYGERTDPYEQINNGQLQVATLVPTPTGFDPSSDVVRSRGSLVTGSDVDFYKIVPVTGEDSVTIRVKGAGVSLLKSRLEIVDATGQVVDQTSSLSVFQNDNSLTVTGLQNHSELYIKVSAVDSTDIYSVGDYGLEIDYRDAAVQANDATPGRYDSGPDAVFSNFDLIDGELGVNENIANAVAAVESSSVTNRRYEIQSSVSSASDVDFFKVTAPDSIDGRLVVHLKGVGSDNPGLSLRVVDSTGQAVGTAGNLRADGTFTVEVERPQANQDYFLRISVDPNSAVGVGNYVAIAEFEAPPTQMHSLASGHVTGEVDKFIRWTAPKTKLFRFDLGATSTDSRQAVRLTVYDAHTREVKAVAVTHAGVTRSALAWLQQGEYILRFTALATGTATVTGADYTLAVDGISDDQDEDDNDPADDPNYAPYHYEYQATYYHNYPNFDGFYYDYDPYYYTSR